MVIVLLNRYSKIMLDPSPSAEENERRLVNTNKYGNGGTDRFEPCDHMHAVYYPNVYQGVILYFHFVSLYI